MSGSSTPEWNAKILKALKENSRRFAKAAKAKATSKRQPAQAPAAPRVAKTRDIGTSELSNTEWAAKILQGLKENSRRFAKAGKAKATAKRQSAPSRRKPRVAKTRGR